MPSQGLSQSHSQDLAISLTLEDEFPELSASQVLAALQQAGGSLEAARQLCSRAVSAAACHPGSAAQQGAPQQHRKWWPASQFCPVEPLVATRSSSFGNSTATSSSAARRPLLVPHQVVPAQRSPATSGLATYQQPAMQPSAGGARGGSQPGVGQQSPATSAIRRLVGGASGDAPSSSSTAAAANVRPPGGILQRSTVAASTTGSTSSGSGSAPAGALPAAAQRRQREAAQGERQPLRPHYAAVFLTDKSRQQLLQHVPPLHEVVTADHMTVAYQPSLDECLALPLGREAALFVAGAAADYRAQAVAVEHPSWLPFLSGTPPHVTVSVGEEVPGKEAGDVTAAALEQPGMLAPVARLKLLQGVVGVQLSDGSRVYAADELQSRLAAAAPTPAAPRTGGPARILKRGAAAPAAPRGTAEPAAAAEPATEPAVPAASPPPATATTSSKAAAWDLDSLMDQLHLAEQPAAPPSGPASSSSSAGPAAAQPQPRRGLLKLPAAVAAEMAAPAREDAGPAAGSSSSGISIRGPPRPLAVRRPQQPQQQPPAPRKQEQQGYGAGAGSSEGFWAEPAAAVTVLGKTVEEEAAEAAAGDAPLDMVSSLAFLLPPERDAAKTPAATAAAAVVSELGPGYETSSSSIASLGEPQQQLDGEVAAAAVVDPQLLQLLQLQFPALHELVVETALRMHGGSLQAAAQFLGVLDQQQQGLAAAAAAQQAGAGPRQPTLGAYLQHVLPEGGPADGAYDFVPPSSSSSSSPASFADSGYDMYHPGAAAAAGGKQRAGAPAAGRGWQQQQQGGGGRGGRGAKVKRNAGDDPMSATERQAMNLHLTAKRIYTQAAQEAFATGQAALGKEMQATARAHADAASSARRRANVSAFRSTNAAVMNSFTLDLHGQHVDEALQSLERYLLTLGGLGHPGGVRLQVITGLGRHSVGNVPRVLPAVVRYLSDAGYKFDSEEGNPGIVNVMIGC